MKNLILLMLLLVGAPSLTFAQDEQEKNLLIQINRNIDTINLLKKESLSLLGDIAFLDSQKTAELSTLNLQVKKYLENDHYDSKIVNGYIKRYIESEAAFSIILLNTLILRDKMDLLVLKSKKVQILTIKLVLLTEKITPELQAYVSDSLFNNEMESLLKRLTDTKNKKEILQSESSILKKRLVAIKE